jgi:radical SAM-linked protein
VCYDCGLDCDLEAIRHERIAQRDSLAQPGPEIEAAFRGEPAPEPAAAPLRLRLPVAPASAADTAARGATAADPASVAPGGNGGDAEHRRELGPEMHVAESVAPTGPPRRVRYRTQFAKLEDLRWLSHLDLMRTLQRAFKRAGVPVTYSQGYHPAPLMSFGPALAVGTEGAGEVFDFESASELDTEDAARRLNACLPAHLRIRHIERLREGAAPLSKIIELGEYTAWINTERQKLDPEIFAPLEAFAFGDPRAHAQRIAAFLGKVSFPVTRSGGKTVDIRPFVQDIEFLPAESRVRLWLRLGSNGQARPQEVLQALYDAPGECFRIRRESLLPARDLAPLPASA